MYSDVEKLSLELITDINKNDALMIGIDGYDGAGKTTLGNKISKLLNIEHIDIDKYIIKKGNDFINNINDKKLVEDISSFDRRKLIVSGICLLKILRRNNINLDILIYVKRYDSTGTYWQDEEDCMLQGNPMDEILKKMERWYMLSGEKKEIRPEDFRYRADIIAYHQKYKPYEKADIIYKRVEDSKK